MANTTQTSVDTAEREAFVKEVNEKNLIYMNAYNDRKFDVIADMHTDDCRFMPSGAPMQIGKEGIAEFWSKALEIGFHKLTTVSKEIMGPSGNMACERCEYWFEDTEGKELQRGKYIVVWRKDDGEWRYHFDIANADHMEPIKK